MDKVTQQNASLVEEASAAAASLETGRASDRGGGCVSTERREARPGGNVCASGEECAAASGGSGFRG